jgi:hypothetical protein
MISLSLWLRICKRTPKQLTQTNLLPQFKKKKRIKNQRRRQRKLTRNQIRKIRRNKRRRMTKNLARKPRRRLRRKRKKNRKFQWTKLPSRLTLQLLLMLPKTPSHKPQFNTTKSLLKMRNPNSRKLNHSK